MIDCPALEDLTVPFTGRSIDSWSEDDRFMAKSFWSSRYKDRSQQAAQIKRLTITCAEYIPITAFEEFTSLQELTLPDTLRKDGFEFSLSYCKDLQKINIPDIARWFEWDHDNAFDCADILYVNGVHMAVPDTIPEGVTRLGNRLFQDRQDIRSISIPEGVKEIGLRTFYGCTALTRVSIPGSVERIEGRTFSECTSLTTVVIPEGCRYLGSYTFSDCSSLTEITFPSTM